MTGLALRSLRHRTPAFVATFVSVLLGTLMIGSFATLVETSTGAVSATDKEALVTMGAVVGGWGTLIVLFSVASTLAVAVGQRAVEIALLRTVGSTPRQARRMIRVETLVVALVGAVLGAAISLVTGRLLLSLLRSGALVAPSVEFAGGPASVGPAALLVVLVSLLAAGIAGRRATRGPATLALADSAAGAGRLRWWRVLAAVVLIGYGLAMGVVTITVTADDPDPYAAMSTSGSCSILVGVGLALLAPVLLRGGALLLRPLLATAGPGGHLASFNASRRAHLLAGVLAPVIVFTAASIGTLMLVSIDGRSLSVVGPEADTIKLLNNVVVGMISLFAAIMVVNAFASVLSARRAELARLRLIGATASQVRGSITAEAAVVAAVGVLAGGAASLATILPFAVARDEGVVPDGQLWLPPVLAGVAVVLTLASARSAVRGVGALR